MDIVTVTVHIDNESKVLSQSRWRHYVQAVEGVVREHASFYRFHGGSSFDAGYQEAAWVFDCMEPDLGGVKLGLAAASDKAGADWFSIVTGGEETVNAWEYLNGD